MKISMYAVPEEIIEGNVMTHPGQVRLPVGLFPHVVNRSTADLKQKITDAFAWYQDNMEVRDGYLVASAAFPALSLDPLFWDKALVILRKFLKGYDRVAGPVILPCLQGTRSAKFDIADKYQRMMMGSTTMPIVTFPLGKPPVDEEIAERATVRELSTTVPDVETNGLEVELIGEAIPTIPDVEEIAL